MALSEAQRHLRWYGRPEAPPTTRRVDAGRLSAQIQGVDVRRVTWAGVPVMDRLFVAIRDADWGTLPPVLDAEPRVIVEPDLGRTTITVQARHADPSIRFVWDGRIAIGPDATLSMEMEGVAERGYRYARMGLCALLPARSMAGAEVASEGGEVRYRGILPRLVGPQWYVDGVDQPLIPAFRELTVTLPEMVVHQVFEGDQFELEDQRNWTDDSFKAYSLMAGEPYPRTARPGQRFWQRITLTVSPTSGLSRDVRPVPTLRSASGPGEVVLVRPTEDQLHWPAIGLGDTSDGRPLLSVETQALRVLRLDHLRVDVRPGAPDWQAHLRRAVAGAQAIDAGVELALSLDDAAMELLPDLAGLLARIRVPRVLVLHAPTQATASTPAGLLGRVRAVLGPSLPDTDWIVGTDGDFAEVNRDRPMPAGPDDARGVCYGMNPQIHAWDEMSMAETLGAQGLTVATTRTWFPGGHVCVTPVTLRQRFNPAAVSTTGGPVAAEATSEEGTDSLPMGVDRRQRSLFGAAWTLGSIAALTASGATSVTWYETVGWRGLAERSRPPTRHAWGPVTPGEVYPVYHPFLDIAELPRMVPLRCECRASATSWRWPSAPTPRSGCCSPTSRRNPCRSGRWAGPVGRWSCGPLTSIPLSPRWAAPSTSGLAPRSPSTRPGSAWSSAHSHRCASTESA